MGLKPKYEPSALGIRDLLKKKNQTCTTTKTIKTHKRTKHKPWPTKKPKRQTWRFIEDKNQKILWYENEH